MLSQELAKSSLGTSSLVPRNTGLDQYVVTESALKFWEKKRQFYFIIYILYIIRIIYKINVIKELKTRTDLVITCWSDLIFLLDKCKPIDKQTYT